MLYKSHSVRKRSGVIWSTSSFISRATSYLQWHTSLGNFLFGGKADSETSFLFLLSSCLSTEIQNIIQTQPSAFTPTEPFLSWVHNSLCNTFTPLWHLSIVLCVKSHLYCSQGMVTRLVFLTFSPGNILSKVSQGYSLNHSHLVNQHPS